MDDKMLQLISAYVDQQATPAEIEQVEALLRQDTEARRIFQEMQAFNGALNATAPAETAAPAGFRESVMRRIHQVPGHPDSGPKGSKSGGSGWSKWLLSPYMASGLVLTGLLGIFAYLDHMEKPPYRVEGVKQDALLSFKNDSQSKNRALPHYRGGPGEGKSQTLSPEDIRELQMQTDQPDQQRGKELRGEVFVQGQGRARKAGTVSPDESRRIDVGLLYREKGAVSNLDNFSAGSADQLTRRYPGHIHPGLLVAAIQTLKAKNIKETAHRIHASLEASAGQPEQVRLARLISELGGDISLLPKWKAMIQPDEE
jgi:anti-sigma factor RsiW